MKLIKISRANFVVLYSTCTALAKISILTASGIDLNRYSGTERLREGESDEICIRGENISFRQWQKLMKMKDWRLQTVC